MRCFICLYHIYIYIYIYVNVLRTIMKQRPMDLGIPPLRIKNLLESNPLKSRFVFCGLAIEFTWGFGYNFIKYNFQKDKEKIMLTV